jgi:hypothetical protein
MIFRRVLSWWIFFWSPFVVNGASFLEGSVTDEQGRPIAGASVKIWDCVGSCLGGTTVLTDAEGHYVFGTKPFQNYPLLSIDLPGRYEVSRLQTGPKLEDADSGEARRVNFVLGTPASAIVHLGGDAPAGWTQKLLLRAGRDVKLQRYDSTPDSNQFFQLLPRNESLHLVVVREPVVKESDDPKETEERRRENWRNEVEIISPPFKLVSPQQYNIRATVASDKKSESSYIMLTSVTDALGNDRTKELTVRDLRFGQPVGAAAQEKALALIERVKSAATPWNGAPSKKIDAYEYDVIDRKGGKTHVKIDHDSPPGPGWNDIARVRGFAYMPPSRWLFTQPENVVFHGVDINEDRAVLHYRLKSARGFAAGLGVGPWNGFFTANFSSGTIVIDTKTATVLEHRLSRGPLGQESVETFGDYVAEGEGYAPRSLRIQSGSQDYRLIFRVHEGKLWLLDKAFHGEDKEPAIKIENVVLKLAG